MKKFEVIFENTDEKVNESWLDTLGAWIKWFVKRTGINEGKKIKIRGTRDQVDSFTAALKEERKYFLIAQKEGSMSRELMEQEEITKQAVEKFQELTKIPWPIK